MKRFFIGIAVLGMATWTFASQTYVPPPPPKLPAMLSKEKVRAGKRLFMENVWETGNLEIYNYLGKRPCKACHDTPHKLDPQKLANHFKNLKEDINSDIEHRMEGTPLPLESPAMESLVQYLVDRYDLYKHKLSK